MLHLMRQALADTAAASQDDRPAAGGDVDSKRFAQKDKSARSNNTQTARVDPTHTHTT